MRLMTVLSSRGRFVPVGGWPTAEADLLCCGCDLLELPCWRGLSFSLRRDCAALAAALAASSRCDELPGVRCDEVLGGGMGPPVVAELLVAGEFCVEGGSGCARGVFSAELWETAGELCVWGVVGVFGDAPLLGLRAGLRAEPGEAVAGDCCW